MKISCVARGTWDYETKMIQAPNRHFSAPFFTDPYIASLSRLWTSGTCPVVPIALLVTELEVTWLFAAAAAAAAAYGLLCIAAAAMCDAAVWCAAAIWSSAARCGSVEAAAAVADGVELPPVAGVVEPYMDVGGIPSMPADGQPPPVPTDEPSYWKKWKEYHEKNRCLFCKKHCKRKYSRHWSQKKSVIKIIAVFLIIC